MVKLLNGGMVEMKGEEMSKVVIDESLCTGCGLCAANCPDLFEMGDDNIAHLTSSGSKTCDLKEAADQCPVTAISIK